METRAALAHRIYLDHAATTPMLPAARAATAEGCARWANPSSPHAEGRAAKAALEDARARIKAALGWRDELIFTSGASEAAMLAMARARGGTRIVSSVEHDAIVRAAPGALRVAVDAAGRIDRQALADALAQAQRPVVAIQHVNPETGRRQPIGELAEIVRAAGGVLVADCAQSAGKTGLPEADMAIVSAHKLGGPPGIGALLVRDLGLLDATGGQEKGYRGGTENLPAILGFAAAAEAKAWDFDRIRGAVVDLARRVDESGGQRVAGDGASSPWIEAVAMPGVSAAAQLIRFDLAGIAVSAGSACASGTMKPSRVLQAFGLPADVAARTIRISYGWNTTPDEIVRFGATWCAIAQSAAERAA